MNAEALIFIACAGMFLLGLPRHWAALPLLMAATYIPIGQSMALGPFHFTAIRILVALGTVRAKMRGERLSGGLNVLDKLMILLAVWGVFSSFFHKDVAQALIYRLGLAYDALGLYFLFRIFITGTSSMLGMAKVVVISLIPIALEMLSENFTGANRFSQLGGVSAFCAIRAGKVRAQGPFAHAILAGTVAALCSPLTLLLWGRNRALALLGLAATGSMVWSSRSSGPIMTLIFVLTGLSCWPLRNHMRGLRWMILIGLIGLSLAMNAPIYYLLNRINLTGSSDSYHRAFLIDSAIHHLDEWWLGGTDHTRHWTSENGSNQDETDITNYYLRMGVNGGMPMLLLFVACLVAGFSLVGRALRQNEGAPPLERFLIWTLGAILFGHTATMMSVSYFDQSVVYLYLSLALVGSIQKVTTGQPDLGVEAAGEPALAPGAVEYAGNLPGQEALQDRLQHPA